LEAFHESAVQPQSKQGTRLGCVWNEAMKRYNEMHNGPVFFHVTRATMKFSVAVVVVIFMISEKTVM
jgi:hypothetical protein